MTGLSHFGNNNEGENGKCGSPKKLVPSDNSDDLENWFKHFEQRILNQEFSGISPFFKKIRDYYHPQISRIEKNILRSIVQRENVHSEWQETKDLMKNIPQKTVPLHRELPVNVRKSPRNPIAAPLFGTIKDSSNIEANVNPEKDSFESSEPLGNSDAKEVHQVSPEKISLDFNCNSTRKDYPDSGPQSEAIGDMNEEIPVGKNPSPLDSLLASLDLEHLIDVFKVQDIDLDILKEMGHEDLEKIGIVSFGKRHKIIKASKKFPKIIEKKKSNCIKTKNLKRLIARPPKSATESKDSMLLKCPEANCEFSFVTRVGLNLHLQSNHGKTEYIKEKVECRVCGKLVLHPAQHMRKAHKAENAIICEICGDTIATDILKHIGKCKNCPVCGKYIFKKERLLKHIKSHSVSNEASLRGPVQDAPLDLSPFKEIPKKVNSENISEPKVVGASERSEREQAEKSIPNREDAESGGNHSMHVDTRKDQYSASCSEDGMEVSSAEENPIASKDVDTMPVDEQRSKDKCPGEEMYDDLEENESCEDDGYISESLDDDPPEYTERRRYNKQNIL